MIKKKGMVVTYHLEENELDEAFYQKLKDLFKDKRVSITVAEEMDETSYLLSNPVNAERLLAAVKNVEHGNIVSVDFDELKQLIAE